MERKARWQFSLRFRRYEIQLAGQPYQAIAALAGELGPYDTVLQRQERGFEQHGGKSFVNQNHPQVEGPIRLSRVPDQVKEDGDCLKPQRPDS
jgi:transposase-like protein